MENHGKIMEFESGKALGTLYDLYNLTKSVPDPSWNSPIIMPADPVQKIGFYFGNKSME